MYPVYMRGLAYISAHDGAAAAAQFRRIVDHPGLGINFPLGALARLGLRQSVCALRRQRQGTGSLSGVSYPLEGCGPGRADPETSQGRICQVAVIFWCAGDTFLQTFSIILSALAPIDPSVSDKAIYRQLRRLPTSGQPRITYCLPTNWELYLMARIGSRTAVSVGDLHTAAVLILWGVIP
jgi:hypothetical protein